MALAASLSSGCAHQDGLTLLATGPDADLSATSAQAYFANQEDVYQILLQRAGRPRTGTGTVAGKATYQEPASPDDWQEVMSAGYSLANSQCDDYLGKLQRLDRARRTTTNELTLTGTATAAAMGLVQASSAALAATAVAFGLAGTTVDNLSNGVLYGLDPAATADLVHRLQKAYRDSLLKENVHGRATIFGYLQNYIRICLPNQIEIAINNSIKNSEIFVAPSTATGQPPVVTTNPGASPDTVPQRPLSSAGTVGPPRTLVHGDFDSAGDLILRRVTTDPQAAVSMKSDCWPAAGIPTATPVRRFLDDPQFEAARPGVARCMGLM